MDHFSKIAGYEKEKAELRSLVEIFNDRKKYEAKGANLPKGIIFYGEAGTGKTLFSRILAEACQLKTIIPDLTEISSEVGICRKLRRAYMKAAKSKEPTVIFIDELDKLLPNPNEEYYTDRAKSILTQLLTLMDGMETVSNVVMVATCNDYAALPPSLTRAGRFDKKIGLGLPDLSSRIAILGFYREQSPVGFAMSDESIARLTSGFSCAALKTLINECVLHSDENNLADEGLIRRKIREISEEDLPSDRSEQEVMIDAVRNAGAFLVSRTYSVSAYTLSVKPGDLGNSFLNALVSGIDDDEYEDDYDEDYEDDSEDVRNSLQEQKNAAVFSKTDYLAAISSFIGSYAAEELFFGKIYDNLTYSLKTADKLITQMSQCGMLGLNFFYNDYRIPDIDYPESFLEKLHGVITSVRLECYEKAKKVIEKNLPLLKALSVALAKRQFLEKKECEEIIARLGGIIA